jgi:hypothetical protein
MPEEQVLGWGRRLPAEGLEFRSLTAITDPDGELGQIWLSAEYAGNHWVLRMDQFRQEGDIDPVMVDMAAEYDGVPNSIFGPISWLAGKTVQVQADGAVYRSVTVDEAGMFLLPQAASRVVVGLGFVCRLETLPASSNGDNGPARDKMKRISRVAIDVLDTRGLRISSGQAGGQDLEELRGDSLTDSGFARRTGLIFVEDVGDHDRSGALRVERVAPTAATIRGVQPTLEVQQR